MGVVPHPGVGLALEALGAVLAQERLAQHRGGALLELPRLAGRLVLVNLAALGHRDVGCVGNLADGCGVGVDDVEIRGLNAERIIRRQGIEFGGGRLAHALVQGGIEAEKPQVLAGLRLGDAAADLGHGGRVGRRVDGADVDHGVAPGRAGHDRMAVRLDEARHQGGAGEVDDFGRGCAEAHDVG